VNLRKFTPDRTIRQTTQRFVQTLPSLDRPSLSTWLKTASSPPSRVCTLVMKPQDVRVGMRVKVAEHHRIEQRRGLVGKVVGRYGGEEHVVVDVRFPDGRQRLFWPSDLEEVASPRPWWRYLRGGER
jgi:hypothetical protein